MLDELDEVRECVVMLELLLCREARPRLPMAFSLTGVLDGSAMNGHPA